MTWADALPNLLIGLREGLEAGLVVSILLAALRRTDPGGSGSDPGGSGPGSGRPVSSAPIWLGVTGALGVAGAFAAVLTFSTSVLSSRGQEAVGGVLSVLAVGLVTAMIFWMRRTAGALAGDLRSKVNAATHIGAGALAATAFLAVGREGLETTLFLWTAVRASGETAAPLAGAAVGLAAAVLLCRLLYVRAVRLDLGVFFSRTALALIVIAAGVLAYGLGDLQDAGLLPGHTWTAFDVTGTVAADSWWATVITGVTELAPRMTWLQVVAWGAYLGVVGAAFVGAGARLRRATRTHLTPAPGTAPGTAPHPARPRTLTRHPWLAGTALVAVPALVAGTAIAALPSPTHATTTLTVTARTCAQGWHTAHAGAQTFAVTNRSGRAGEINLDDATGAVAGEIETLGPGTTAQLTATLTHDGVYTFHCLLSGQRPTTSTPVQVTGKAAAGTATTGPTAFVPVTLAELQPAATAYQAYVAPKLATLTTQVAALTADLKAGNTGAARTDWLPAQLTWDQMGAAYDSFGDLGDAVDGLPQGLPQGTADPSFTGLHRLEYGLWHGQSPQTLLPFATRLTTDLTKLRTQLPKLTVDPTDLPLRAHEILEDALRDRLSGMADEGSGAAYPETYADLQGTRVVLAELGPLIDQRAPLLRTTIALQLDALDRALLSAKATDTPWLAPSDTPLATREQITATLDAALESLSQVPDLLEVPPSR